MKYQHVYLEWIDSSTHSEGWTEIDKHKFDSDYVKTSGFIILESDDYISVALSIDEVNNMYNGCIDIPKICIVKREAIG